MTTLQNYEYDTLPKYGTCAIIGKRGTGKTSLCRNLVQSQLSQKNISHTYIICHPQKLYEWKDKLNTQNISYHHVIDDFLIAQMELKINLNEKIIIVIDDFFSKKNQNYKIFELKALRFITYQYLSFVSINYINIIFFLRENNNCAVSEIYLTIKKYFIDVPTYEDFVKIFFTVTQNFSALVVDGCYFKLFRINANDIITQYKPNNDYIIESVDFILRKFNKVKFITGFEILI
ncbi:divergent ATPase [Saudi moumouvirus]|nr:divergent ATPase [Saudi moumouvirus]